MRLIILMLVMLAAGVAQAAEYKIDTSGAHAFIQFKIKHLGYSWLYGRFDRFDGSFQYDAKNPAQSAVQVTIEMKSLNTNHAERDKHLRGEAFFNVATFPQATFVSKSFVPSADGKRAKILGLLTLKGVTKEIALDVEQVGGGPDPWGGVRLGYTGTSRVVLKDFGINVDLGPASTVAELQLDIEGVKK